MLGPGDQVRTSNGGVALLTFFDGSETLLTPDTQVEIQQASTSIGPQIAVSQILGTTVDRVQRLTSQPTSFTIDTPDAKVVVRGTRYVVTVKCYATNPPLPPTRLLTFPRRLSGAQFLLADEAVYDDSGTLWEARAWQDPTTGETFDTYDQIGATYPEVSESLYQETDGSFWLDREWQDPDTGATWHTYEDVGVPADDLAAASLPTAHVAARPAAVAQAQAGCHPVTSIVVIEGRVGVQPKVSSLTAFDLTPGLAGAASDVATASSPLSAQGLQAFDQATSNLRDVNAARAAGQLGSQVADEFAAVIVTPPSGPPGGPPPGGPGGPGGPTGVLGSGPTSLLAGVVVRSASADSGLLDLVVPQPPEPAGVEMPLTEPTPVPPPEPTPAVATTPSAQQQIDKLSQGQYTWTPPRQMRLGENVVVEARVGFDNQTTTTALRQGLVRPNDAISGTVLLSSHMTATLSSTDGLRITAITEQTQEAPEGIPYLQWAWRVEAMKPGSQPLNLMISATVADRRSTVKVLDQEVEVPVDPVYLTADFVETKWQWILGGGLAPLGGLAALVWKYRASARRLLRLDASSSGRPSTGRRRPRSTSSKQ
jgi:FecR protein